MRAAVRARRQRGASRVDNGGDRGRRDNRQSPGGTSRAVAPSAAAHPPAARSPFRPSPSWRTGRAGATAARGPSGRGRPPDPLARCADRPVEQVRHGGLAPSSSGPPAGLRSFERAGGTIATSQARSAAVGGGVMDRMLVESRPGRARRLDYHRCMAYLRLIAFYRLQFRRSGSAAGRARSPPADPTDPSSRPPRRRRRGRARSASQASCRWSGGDRPDHQRPSGGLHQAGGASLLAAFGVVSPSSRSS